MVEITAFARLTIHHGIAVEPPRLTARPRRRIGITLTRDMVDRFARFFVVPHDVVRAGIGTIVVVHRDIGVRLGHFIIGVVARKMRRYGQQFEVHHVVDDDRIPPLVGVPRTGAAYCGIETCGEVARCRNDYVAIGLLVRQAVAVAVGAIDGEADVVIVRAVLFALHAFGELFGDAAQLFAAAVFVEVPHRTGKKSAGPPADGTGDERIVGRIPAAWHLVGRILDRFIEAERLFDGEIECPVDGAYRRLVACRKFFRPHGRGEADEKSGE